MHLLIQLILIGPAVALAGWLYAAWGEKPLNRPFRPAAERRTEFLSWPAHR